MYARSGSDCVLSLARSRFFAQKFQINADKARFACEWSQVFLPSFDSSIRVRIPSISLQLPGAFCFSPCGGDPDTVSRRVSDLGWQEAQRDGKWATAMELWEKAPILRANQGRKVDSEWRCRRGGCRSCLKEGRRRQSVGSICPTMMLSYLVVLPLYRVSGQGYKHTSITSQQKMHIPICHTAIPSHVPISPSALEAELGWGGEGRGPRDEGKGRKGPRLKGTEIEAWSLAVSMVSNGRSRCFLQSCLQYATWNMQ